MNARAAVNAFSTSEASSAGGCESSSRGLCDIAQSASVMGVSGGEVKGGGEGGGDGRGVLSEGSGCDVPVGSDDDEADGVGVEPGLEPAGGVADHGHVGGLARVTGRCGVPMQLGGRADADQLHAEPGQGVQGAAVEYVAGVVAPHEDREPVAEDVVEEHVLRGAGVDAGLREHLPDGWARCGGTDGLDEGADA